MRNLGWAVMALAVACAPARADSVLLHDGTLLRGATTREGDTVVVQQKLGEARVHIDRVWSISRDDEVPPAPARKAADAPAAAAPAREAAEQLPAGKAIEWEKDAAEAAALAELSGRIVLTYVVVGELGAGDC